MPLSAGDKLGPYEILAQVGAGGMGEVYKARDTRLDRVVAIKVSNEKFSERFEREARAVAALNHPNICQLYDVGPNYLVMEFIEGSPIAPADSPRKLLDIAVQIADGLAAAHGIGLVHRDLKPDNILITRDGRVKILDFGLAKSATRFETDDTRTMALTDPGTTVGTVNYMSPEQARGQADLTPQSDQFSFGLVLYELATGKRPFHRGSAAETMAAIIREDAEPLPAGTPAPLRWIVERLLSKEPAERYDSTRDLYRELRQVRERLSESTSAVRTSGAVPAPGQRRILPIALTALVCLGLGTAISLLLLPPASQDLSAYKFTPLSRQDATERDPAWSPDGKSIAFTTSVHGISQVFTKAIDSQDAAQITHADASCDGPLWSPDGSTIYYTLRNGTWAVPVSGGMPELVLANSNSLSIHPDGKTIAFIRDSKLWVGSFKGEQPRQFGAAPFPNSQVQMAQFSPDGSKLLTGAMGDGWILPYPSGTPSKIPVSFSPAGSSWFPDSRHLLLSDAPSPTTGTLWKVDIVDGSQQAIYRSASPQVSISLSPDGKRIAYMGGQVEWDVLEISLPSGTVRTAMSGSGVISWWPDWSPSGTHYLVNTDRSGSFGIEDVSAAEGFSRRLIVPGPGESVIAPQWSPDGARFFFFGGAREKGLKLMLSNASGGRAIPVNTEADFLVYAASWSPDGRWITYFRLKPPGVQIVKTHAPTAAAPEIVRELSAADAPRSLGYLAIAWSPANDWIVYPNRNGTQLVSPDGKVTRKLTERKFHIFGFSKDGSQLFGIVRNTSGEGAQWQLYSVEVKTGAEKFLAPIELPASADTIAGFSLHPDGKRLLTAIAKWPLDIWMMEGFDRQKSWRDRLLRR